MLGPLAWFANNHVAANLLMLFLLIAGVLSLRTIKLEIFPEMDTEMITVQVPYLGASPEEVEEGVCMRVEEAVEAIQDIKEIRSTSGEGFGLVSVEVEEYADVQEVLDDVKAEVDRIETFPAETEKPIITKLTTRRQVISVVIFGDVAESTLKNLADEVKDELTARRTISQVELAGVRRNEISIEVSEQTLQRYGLTFDRVAGVIRGSSLDLPGGSVKTAGGEILVRTKGQKYVGRDFEDVVVLTRNDGTKVYLHEVAEIIDGFEDSDIVTRFDGKPAALIQVYAVGEQGALDVAEEVKAYVAEKRERLPAGVSISTWSDRSKILRSRIGLLTRNAYLGLALVFICLSLWLDLRLAFWTTMGIPISFLGAFFLLPFFGVSVNMVSLFAFIVVLGIVVDDAIVVGENIFNYRQKGMGALEAAVKGVGELWMPVMIAVLTTIAAFFPLLHVAGTMGKVMRQIPLVVISVLAISLVEALFILPAHLSRRGHDRKPGPIGRGQMRLRMALDRFVQGPFDHLVGWCIRYRYITLALGLALMLVVTGTVIGGHIRFSFFPKVPADNVMAYLEMPQGTPVEQTEQVVRRLEAAAEKVRAQLDQYRLKEETSLFNHVSTSVGQQTMGGGPGGGSSRSGGNLAMINIELLDGEERDKLFPKSEADEVSSMNVSKLWREAAGEIPGVSSLTYQSSLFSVGEAINVELSHKDFGVLLAAADRLKQLLGDYDGVIDITDSFVAGKQELKLSLTDQGRTLGLVLSDLARQVRQGFYGEEVQRVQRGRDDIRVMLRYPQSQRKSLTDIENMRIRLANGTEAAFGTVARGRLGHGYATINRTNRRRVVQVTADVDATIANANEINADLRGRVLVELQNEFPGLFCDFQGEQREQKETFGSLGVNFVIALLAIFGLLAIQFRSYIQPVIIMSAIPFGIIGAVIGHLLMGLYYGEAFNLTLLSMFGIVALTGVVVNDSLIMVDLINRQNKEGLDLVQVVHNSATRRFRPIILTTLTTFFGLSPMILEKSLQARFLIPMAVSLGFGVLFATGITLVLVPALYVILEDIKKQLRLMRGDVKKVWGFLGKR